MTETRRAMPLYRLRCTYARAQGNWSPIIGSSSIEAETDAEAVEAAQAASQPEPGLILSTAMLFGPTGRFVWAAPSNPDADRPDQTPQGSGL